MLRACVIALIGLALATSAPSDDLPPVRIDAVVTDTAGRAITDLEPSDFELRENGELRPLESVQLRGAARQDGRPRAFAFFLDEYHVSSGAATTRVRESLRRFIERHMRTGDLGAVIKPLEPVAALRFTANIGELRDAIATFEGRKGDHAPRSAFEEQYIGRAAVAVEAARRQIVSSALREIALRLGGVAVERAVLVLASEGFARQQPPSLRQVRVSDLQALVRGASRFHLAVYAFNPADAAASDGAATLEYLARETGGRAVLEGAGLDAGLERMAADLESYYALTYRPKTADGRFHPLRVTAKRRNALVRARPGYWAPLGSELRAMIASPAEAKLPSRSLKRSALVSIWTGVSREPDGTLRMGVTWEPAITRGRGASQARVVLLEARSAGGETLFKGELAPAGSGAGMVPDLAAFTVPAGRIEVDATVLDIRGVVLDSDVRDVDVPDVSRRPAGPVLFTPEIVRARTAPEFRAASANPAAAPTAARAFSRGDRLLVRIAAWDPSGADVAVAASVTNAIGGTMREIAPLGEPRGGRWAFDLPLAWLAPGEYSIVLVARGGPAESRHTVRFSVR